jgi:hypothetical protein
MARFKSYLVVVVGFAIAGTIGAAFGTGTAQAIVSSLVTVVNPGTSPVQTNSVNVTDPGRIPYVVQQTLNANQCVSNSCIFTLPQVPAGKRVVVQQIGAWATGITGTTPIVAEVSEPTVLDPFVFFSAAPVSGVAGLNEPVQVYVDQGQSLLVSLGFNGDTLTSPVALTVNGYELDCTAAPCAPIATQ